MRIKLFLIAAFTFLFSACNSQAVESTSTPSPAPTLPVTQTPLPEPSCSAITMEPTPSSSAEFLVTADDLMLGSLTAPVTVINYCDLQSLDCYGLGTIFDKLLDNHPNDLRLVIRPIPLLEMDGFENSMIAAQAMIAAQGQGKQHELYDLLFGKYGEWASLSPSAFEAWLARETPAIGLDKTKFTADLKSNETIAIATDSYTAAKAIGVQPPYPLVLLNGIPVNVGLLYYEYLDQSISLIALGARQFTECPPFLVDPSKQYIATLHTEKGDIVIQLFADKAPLAVNSFVFLANEGWYDNVTFHRVIPGFVAQAGDPSGTGQGGPGYFFKNENSDLRFDKPGLVGMANSGTDTNGSQFFITFSPQPQLDGGYTIFGQVLQGMEVVESLTSRDPQQGLSLPPGDKILTVEITEK